MPLVALRLSLTGVRVNATAVAITENVVARKTSDAHQKSACPAACIGTK